MNRMKYTRWILLTLRVGNHRREPTGLKRKAERDQATAARVRRNRTGRQQGGGSAAAGAGGTPLYLPDHHIAQGDVLIIPAGTPHKFKKANEFTVYTVVRIDADGVTPLLK